MKKIAVILPLLFFIVTWNEYVLDCYYYGDTFEVWFGTQSTKVNSLPYKQMCNVELSTQTINLERQIDVDRFVGKRDTFKIPAESYNGMVDFYVGQKGIMSRNAFNIRVEEKQ